HRRRSVVFPEPFGPVTSRKSPRSTSRSIPSRTRLSPKRLPRPRARITDAPSPSTPETSCPLRPCPLIGAPGLLPAASVARESARMGAETVPKASRGHRVEKDKSEEDEADHAVHGEKRELEPPEVVRPYHGVLVG